MSTLNKFINVAKSMTSVFCHVRNRVMLLNETSSHLLKGNHTLKWNAGVMANQCQKFIHSSSARRDLMEFFDNPKNWSENEVKVGRAWKTDELRIKSNKELHQLWYVVLKERNMLLTMEHECNDKMEIFPNPERLDKVKITMRNIETVVRERNKAYYLLETGETGERPQRLVSNALGMQYNYKSCEHALPPFMNVKWIKSRQIGYGGRAVRKFLTLYREKLYNSKRKAKNRMRNEVMMLLRRNPNLDLNLLRRKFPDVNIEQLVNKDKIRGHFVPKVGV